MAYPALVNYQTELEYRRHFERVYCQGTIQTFDGIKVRFRKQQFDHCFFESIACKDDTFSIKRAERVDWIKAVLEDENVELRLGWDNKKKRAANDRRVALVVDGYVVVIRIRGSRASLITAFVANSKSIEKIRTNPLWG